MVLSVVSAGNRGLNVGAHHYKKKDFRQDVTKALILLVLLIGAKGLGFTAPLLRFG